MERLLSISNAIDAFIRALAQITGWFFLVAVVIICFDVFSRKFGYQLPYFTSTRLQELEWHVTSALFLCWLAYGMVKNSHVRIDVFTLGLSQRTRDWIEFIGTLIFALPYCLIVFPYSVEYFWTSLLQLEASDAPNGLPARYVIKGFMAFGLLMVLLAAISILIRKAIDLFGPPEWHSESRSGEGVEI